MPAEVALEITIIAAAIVSAIDTAEMIAVVTATN
jgi:hypothetical protein